MAEHVRFHMTSVPVSGSSEFSLFSYREEGSEREREERDGEREPRRGLYARAGLAGTSRPRLLSAPRPISARQRLEGPGPRGRGRDSRREAGVRDTGARSQLELKLVTRDCPHRAKKTERPREWGRSAGDIHFRL